MTAPSPAPPIDPLAEPDAPASSRLEYTPEERYLFQTMTGFFRSKLLAVAERHDLFGWLGMRPRTLEQLREKLGFAERPARIFADALVAMGLLMRVKDKYQPSPVASRYLVRGRLSFQGPTIKLFDALYDKCADLEQVLKSDQPNDKSYTYFFSKERTGGSVEEYSGHMDETATGPVMVLHEFVDFSQSKKVLDVGGGYGRTAMTLVSQYPELEATVFDLPEVLEQTRAKLADFYLAHRVKLCPGDFFADPFPGGMDTVMMMRITHDWATGQVRTLLRKAFDALEPGGRLLIYETLKEEDPAAPGDAALVSLLLLLISPGGECRGPAELRALLEEVGFADVEVIPTIYIYSVVLARKP